MPIKPPRIKTLDTPDEIRRKTEELLGDASDETIKTFIALLENFKDEREETAYHNIGISQRTAFGRTLAFENAFRTFAGLPGGSQAEENKKEESADAGPPVWNYDSKAEN